jgi:hypothetical protein
VSYAYAVKSGPWIFLTGHEAFDFESGIPEEVAGPSGFPLFGRPRSRREGFYSRAGAWLSADDGRCARGDRRRGAAACLGACCRERCRDRNLPILPFLGFLSREIVDRAVLSLKDAGVPSFLIE